MICLISQNFIVNSKKKTNHKVQSSNLKVQCYLMMSDIPGRNPSSLVIGRAFTSKVLRS